jgi:hypothetical protein
MTQTYLARIFILMFLAFCVGPFAVPQTQENKQMSPKEYKKLRKQREREAVNLVPRATIRADIKRVRSELVRIMIDRRWDLSSDTQLSLVFQRPGNVDGSAFGYMLGARMSGDRLYSPVDEVKFTLIEQQDAVEVVARCESVFTTRDGVKRAISRANDGNWNLGLQEVLDSIKHNIEGDGR